MSILWREGHSHGCWEPVQMLLSSRLLQDQEKVCLHFLFQAIGFVLWVDALILKWASIFSCIFLGFFFLFSFSLYINFHWISMEVSELFSVLKNIIWNSHLNSLIFGLFFLGFTRFAWRCERSDLGLVLNSQEPIFLVDFISLLSLWNTADQRLEMIDEKKRDERLFAFLLCQKRPIQHLISWNGNRPMPWQFFYFIKF